jgi:hypothetical protein
MNGRWSEGSRRKCSESERGESLENTILCVVTF